MLRRKSSQKKNEFLKIKKELGIEVTTEK